MKRIFLLIIVLFLCSCDVKKEENNIIDNIATKEEAKITYIDDNPIKLGLYLYTNSWTSRKLVTDYITPWNQSNDIVSFEVFMTNEKEISGSTFQNIWNDYYVSYDNIDDYNVGFNIKYTLITGEEINHNILNPSDVWEIFNYVQIYLYDDVNQEIGAWYSHITEEEYSENTIISSIKLTASTYIDDINSPIELTVFTYNDSEDFDSITNMYRGNSFYSIVLKRS